MRYLFIVTLVFGLTAVLPVSAQERVSPVNREQVTLSFAGVVKKATPAVVNIYTRRVVKSQMPAMFDDPLFRQFFGQGFGGLARERVEQSLGSGVIVRPTGVVITNNHVAGNADQITVVLSDKREFDAKLVGKDERSDLAVLQLQGLTGTLPSMDLANSDDAEVGDMVLAIGDPFGVGQTVTFGIVSALARTAVGTSDFQSFIQTDAAINPGNSGGALITSDGRLIGINAAIYSQSGGNIGIGFAIPANMARTVLTGILKEGHAVHAWLGASGKTINADLAKNLGLDRPEGVVIERVLPASPAMAAGLAVGDIVRTINGRDIQDMEELRYMIASLPVGGKTTLGTLRDGKERSLALALVSPPDIPVRKSTLLSGREPFAGATIANLNPALADEMGKDYAEPRVVVTAVDPQSFAASLGLRPGDFIATIGDETMTSVDGVKQATAVTKVRWHCVIMREGRAYEMNPGIPE